VILGHSFVAGLDQHYRAKFSGHPDAYEAHIANDLHVSNHIRRVFLLGVSGASIPSYEVPIFTMSQIRPSIILIDLGSNDLLRNFDNTFLAGTLFQIAQFCKEAFQAPVGICSVLPRTGHLGDCTPERFECAMTIFNNLLRSMADQDSRIFYHSHIGFWETQDRQGHKTKLPVSEWSLDGIHPNHPNGRKKYKNSLRNALCKALKLL
jgi:lysophospholipase L1-like esterase